MTHELELPENLNTYLSRALSPVRPLYTFGRSFGAQPRIARERAVWDFWQETCAHCVTHPLHDVGLLWQMTDWENLVQHTICCDNYSLLLDIACTRCVGMCQWRCCSWTINQDVALPFIASDRFESDTLFLVFENDFRFRENDQEEPPLRTAAALRSAGDAPVSALPPVPPGEKVV